MPDGMSVSSDESCDTQLRTIRDLMLSAAQRGAWLTLGEIARLTEIGEASISAQLRHLRKWRYGRHRVEKRVRQNRPTGPGFTAGARAARKWRAAGVPTMWEYQVLPPAPTGSGPAGWEMFARSHDEGEAQQLTPRAASDGNIPGFVPTCEMEEACCDENGRVETKRCGDGPSGLQQGAGEVSDAEASD